MSESNGVRKPQPPQSQEAVASHLMKQVYDQVREEDGAVA